jgi:hypothetical protein
MAPERYPEYLPYLKKFDILAMAEQGVLAIEPKMVDPKKPRHCEFGHRTVRRRLQQKYAAR